MDVVGGEELRGMAYCIESGFDVLKYSAKQRLMSEIKQQNISASIFEQYMSKNHLLFISREGRIRAKPRA